MNILLPFTTIPKKYIFKIADLKSFLFTFLLLVFSALSYGQTQSYNFTDGNFQFQFPPIVKNATISAWGAGGAGGGVETGNGNKVGAGGGGGAFAQLTTLPIISGIVYDGFAGKGGVGIKGDGPDGSGSWFVNQTTILAKGGTGGGAGKLNSYGKVGVGGVASAPIGNPKFSGGTGHIGFLGNYSGAGGGSAGFRGNGGDATNKNGGLAGLGFPAGIKGADGSTATPGWNDGGFPGGGGSGSRANGNGTPAGGNGGNGKVNIVYDGYCRPISKNNSTYLSSVSTVGGTNNILNSSTSTNGYQNFYNSHNISILAGNSFTLEFTVVAGTGGAGVAVWVDWDKNNIFDRTEIVYYSNNKLNNGSHTIPNISIPVLVSGDFVMRIVADKDATIPNACYLVDGQGEGEDYKLTVLPAAVCSGTPSPGTIILNKSSGYSSSIITGTGSTNGFSGIKYQWQISINGTNGFTDIPNATTANVNIEADKLPNTTRYYRRQSTCAGFGDAVYSNVVLFKTNNVLTTTYCNPISSGDNKARKIINIKFLGTLNEDTYNPTNATAINYNDYRTNNLKAKQIPGGVINLGVDITNNASPGRIKAWVDWDKNGEYEDLPTANPKSEKIYDPSEALINVTNVVFGFKVPLGTLPGNYNIRIRVDGPNTDFGPCNKNDNGQGRDGETEDYSFEVIADCLDAKILTAPPARTCGIGPAILSATATPGSTFRWYESEFGTAIPKATSSTYTTPDIVKNKTYYVTAVKNGCETVAKTPVRIIFSKVPIITIKPPDNPQICGLESSVTVNSSGNKQEIEVFNEDFQGNTVKFEESREINDDPNQRWFVRDSSFELDLGIYSAISPALSSGYDGGKFVNIMTGVKRATSILNHYHSKDPIITTGVTDLKLDFDLYYFSEEDNYAKNNLRVQYSIDNEITWKTLRSTALDANTSTNPLIDATYIKDIGTPGKFYRESIVLPSECADKSNLKIRYSLFAYGLEPEYVADVVAIDNVRIYGDADLPALFTWTVNDVSAGTLASEFIINPTIDELQNSAIFKIKASALTANGCTVPSLGFDIVNNSKTWNITLPTPPRGSEPTWATTNWYPQSSIPTADKCVIIRSHLQLSTGNGEARSIEVAPGGSLFIRSGKALTVTDKIVNNAEAEDFLVENDANLKQINDAAVNEGSITVKRNSNMKRLDYTYWASSVKNQNLKTFSPGTVNTRFYTYNESTDFFEIINPINNVFGNNRSGVPESAAKGYAIRANNGYPGPIGSAPAVSQLFNGTFTGVANNGVVTFPLKKTGTVQDIKGYNLVGNPYMSNLNFYTLHTNNKDFIYNTAYFWTNVNPNPAMQGSEYPKDKFLNNYAILNAIGGVPATTSAINGTVIPTEFIKVGQGFIVQAKKESTLTFNNGIRTVENEGVFFNKNTVEGTDRFWLHLTTPLDVVTTQLIGYKIEASNGFELDYDSPLMVLGADAFYSILDNQKLAIQGKASFLDTDVVFLGTSHYEDGNYTINLGEKEGVFANGQNIYLKDKKTGDVTNLSESSYTFTANEGLTEGRFEIVYQPEAILGTNNSSKENLIIYRDGSEFVVKSSTKNITSLEVYDASGKLMTKLKPNQKETRIDASSFINGIYILKINQEEQISTKKIMK